MIFSFTQHVNKINTLKLEMKRPRLTLTIMKNLLFLSLIIFVSVWFGFLSRKILYGIERKDFGEDKQKQEPSTSRILNALLNRGRASKFPRIDERSG